jgi:hypothetical protein
MKSLRKSCLFTQFNDSERSCSVFFNKMLRNVSWDIILKYEMILVLLIKLFRTLLNAFYHFNPTIAADQIEVQGLTCLVFYVFEIPRVILKNSVNSLFSLNSECSPLSTHEAHKT